MKKLLIIILALPFFIKAQEKEYTKEDSLKYTYFAIKSPLPSLIDPLISTAPLFLEYRHEQKYAIEAGYFFLIPQLFPDVENKESEKLTKFKTEVKQYFNDEFYIGFEYGFVKYQYGFRDDYFNSNDDFITYQYDYATIKKRIHLFDVKVGVEYIGKKHPRMIYDLFFGIGMRHIKLDYTDVVNQRQLDGLDPDFLAAKGEVTKNAKYDISETNDLKGNFTFGFKIGYKLWSRF